MSQITFEAAEILEELHQKVGSPDFELRVQALLSHTFLRVGWRVQELNHPGHPDIVAENDRGMLRFEVEILSRTAYQVKEDDLKALCPHLIGWRGYLALLDCGPPLLWFILPYEAVQGKEGKILHKPEMKRLSEQELSNKCTKEFCLLVCLNKKRLKNLTFSLLRRWALEGRAI